MNSIIELLYSWVCSAKSAASKRIVTKSDNKRSYSCLTWNDSLIYPWKNFSFFIPLGEVNFSTADNREFQFAASL